MKFNKLIALIFVFCSGILMIKAQNRYTEKEVIMDHDTMYIKKPNLNLQVWYTMNTVMLENSKMD